MDISIIIVTYNQFDKARLALDSVFRSRLERTFEVTIVDNASTEVGLESLARDFPKIKIIRNKTNLGMGAGNNLGAKEASGKYLLILNPDTELHNEALVKMFNYLENNSQTAGLVGPKLIYPDGQRQISCYRYPNIMMPLFRRTIIGKLKPQYLDYYLMKDFDLNQPQEVDWLMGSCLMLTKDLFERLKGFDQRFFMYFEDTDLCRRITSSGLKVIYLPEALVIHYHGRASAKKHWLWALISNHMARIHLKSYLKYFYKWGFFN